LVGWCAVAENQLRDFFGCWGGCKKICSVLTLYCAYRAHCGAGVLGFTALLYPDGKPL
jgi:hypothetical protein